MRQRTERRKTTEQKEKGKIIITKKRGEGEQMKIKGIKTQVRWKNKCVENIRKKEMEVWISQREKLLAGIIRQWEKFS